MARQKATKRTARTDFSFNTSDRMRMMVFATVTVVVMLLAVILRLYILQIRDREKYQLAAATQQLSDETLTPVRGTIRDATGTVLAKSSIVWDVAAYPVKCDQDLMRQAADRLAELMGKDAEALYAQLSKQDSEYELLATKLDKPVADAVKAYAAQLNEEQKRTVLSIGISQNSRREYPYGTTLSSVLGFCNRDGDGFYGLEKYYDETLAGVPGRTITVQNARGFNLDTSAGQDHAAVDGSDLTLSVDSYVQSVVEGYLDAAVARNNVQQRACAIVMNVNTGAILALAVSPGYDPNDPYTIYDTTLSSILDTEGPLTESQMGTLQLRLGQKETKSILEDGEIGADEYSSLQGMLREAQWKNKAITELYIPGSVFKLVTASAALDSGLATMETSFYCGGEISVAEGTDYQTDYHCALGTAHGMQDLATALKNSCNLYFIQLGQRLGAKRLYDYFNAFGFTETTGVDLPYETRYMQYYTEENMGVAELASTSFGQAQSITPMQMATAAAAVVNGGYLVQPYVVQSVTDASGNVVSTTGTTIKRQVISEEVSAQMRTMMERVVGTGNAYVAGYRIGGKSGTTEKLSSDGSTIRPDGDYQKVSSFVGVLPINDPEIEVFVMLDDPRAGNDFASTIVAPVVGNIISDIAPYLGLETDGTAAGNANVVVPQCIGKDTSLAQAAANALGLSHKIVGDESGTVLYQYPAAGITVAADTTVYLYTESETDQMTTVPNLVGQTASVAKQLLNSAELNQTLSGTAEGIVQSQSPEAGTQVPLGTVITVEAVDTSLNA